MTRIGRRAGSPDTRSDILGAARRVFGEVGYDKASVRQIATEAGVDPSLLYHYFGGKDQLYIQSMDIPVVPSDLIDAVVSDRDAVGRGLAQVFFNVWEVEEARASFLGVLRSAMSGDEVSIAAFSEFIAANLQKAIAPVIETDDSDLRALLMATHLVGVAVGRYVVRLEPLVSAPIEDIIDLVAPRIQSYIEP